MVSTTAGGRPLKSAAFHQSPAKVSIWPGAEQLWRTQEGAHGDGQTEAWPRGQRWMVHHAGAGVLDRLGLLLYRRELLGKALDGVAEQPCLADGGVEKVFLHLYQVEPEMALLAFPRDSVVTFVTRRAKSVAVRSSCINPGCTLAW